MEPGVLCRGPLALLGDDGEAQRSRTSRPHARPGPGPDPFLPGVPSSNPPFHLWEEKRRGSCLSLPGSPGGCQVFTSSNPDHTPRYLNKQEIAQGPAEELGSSHRSQAPAQVPRAQGFAASLSGSCLQPASVSLSWARRGGPTVTPLCPVLRPPTMKTPWTTSYEQNLSFFFLSQGP